jgi:CP family cyanate transporter-like MFS transporter
VTPFKSVAVPLALLWLAGVALRLVILAVPPVIPALRDAFHLSGTEIGVLTGVPIFLFAGAALVGSLLVARLGAVTAVVAGLLLAAMGSALRGAAGEVVGLLAATVAMGAGIAVVQPAMPALVGRWLPQRIGFGTGIYANGLLIGEILPVALFPIVFLLVHESWRATFVVWAVPTAVIALLVLVAAPRDRGAPAATDMRFWPRWPAADILRMGSVFAGASALYYATNGFLPAHLTEAGRADLINPALTGLNLGQLPASFLLIAFGKQLERKVWPFVVSGVVSLVCVGLIVATASGVTVAATAIFGFSIGAAFALGLTLPPLLITPGEVARASAAMFTMGYGSAVVVSVLCGLAWDLTGVERFAFLPIALATLPLILFGLILNFDRKAAVTAG